MNGWRAAIRTGNIAAERMGAPPTVHCARKVAYLGPGEQQTRNSGKRLPLKVLKLSCPSSKQSPVWPRHAHRNAISWRDTRGHRSYYTTPQALSRGAPSLSSQAEYPPNDGNVPGICMDFWILRAQKMKILLVQTYRLCWVDRST